MRGRIGPPDRPASNGGDSRPAAPTRSGVRRDRGRRAGLCGAAATPDDDRLWMTGPAPDPSRFGGQHDRAPPIRLTQRPHRMFAQPHALILRHRERVAVLISSALFLAGALPLFWAIG